MILIPTSRYILDRVVSAWKISKLITGTDHNKLFLENGECIEVDDKFIANRYPWVGSYYVLENDEATIMRPDEFEPIAHQIFNEVEEDGDDVGAVEEESDQAKGEVEMGQDLWQQFLDERVESVQEVLLMVGVDGLISEYESWLVENKYLVKENGIYKKH